MTGDLERQTVEVFFPTTEAGVVLEASLVLALRIELGQVETGHEECGIVLQTELIPFLIFRDLTSHLVLQHRPILNYLSDNFVHLLRLVQQVQIGLAGFLPEQRDQCIGNHISN